MIQKYVKSFCLILFFSGLALNFNGCQIAPLMGKSLVIEGLIDGIYAGEYRKGINNAVVKVTISNGRITHIELVEHFASWKGNDANSVIPARIVEQQSTRVDAISGATNSSRVIMNAVQKAIEKAYK